MELLDDLFLLKLGVLEDSKRKVGNPPVKNLNAKPAGVLGNLHVVMRIDQAVGHGKLDDFGNTSDTELFENPDGLIVRVFEI